MEPDATPPPREPPNDARELWISARLIGRSAALVAIAAFAWALGRPTALGWIVLGYVAVIALALGLAVGAVAVAGLRNLVLRRLGLLGRPAASAALGLALLAGYGATALAFWKLVVVAFS